MWREVVLLIKAGSTIVFCTGILFFFLTSISLSSNQEIKQRAFNEIIEVQSISNMLSTQKMIVLDKSKAAANTNNWLQNVPVAWRSHMLPVNTNSID